MFDGFVIRIDPLIGRSGERKISPLVISRYCTTERLLHSVSRKGRVFTKRSAICINVWNTPAELPPTTPLGDGTRLGPESLGE